MAKKGKEVQAEEEEETYELVYTQNVTIQDNHGTIIFKQTGQPPTNPDRPPGGGQ